jgi:uncharacterized protein
MAVFKIFSKKKTHAGIQERIFYYDNMTSSLKDDTGYQIAIPEIKKINANKVYRPAPVNSPDQPLGKSSIIETLKIQLGLACNYSCEYCSQRFVPHAEETNFKSADKFINNLDTWLRGSPRRIEFWGGEPLVYIKTLRPLAEALRIKFPTAQFVMVTNGSLLDPELNEWIDNMGFAIGLSHDGPGMPVRGPDPLDDIKSKEGIVDLIKRLAPQGRISFNAMLNRENMDRAAIQQFFINFYREIGLEMDFHIGEGGMIDPYDEGGMSNSIQDEAESLGFRRLTLKQTRDGTNRKFQVVRSRVKEWVESISAGRPASSLGQKCGMDSLDTIAVDLNGYVLTCQNVSNVATAPNGRSHAIGHVSQFDKIKLTTSTHWSKRAECSDCPVLQACKGACMYLEKDYWIRACNNAYDDHVPFFAVALEELTGYLPYRIEHEKLPEHRQNIWGEKDAKAVVPKTREKGAAA